MISTKSLLLLGLVAVAVLVAALVRANRREEPPPPAAEKAPAARGVPTFVELGSESCASCRAMIPVLEELRQAHACALEVRFVDVWDDPAEGQRFGVRAIPTQVLLAPDGRELTRHTGFWSAGAIRAAFASAGFPLARDAEGCEP